MMKRAMVFLVVAGLAGGCAQGNSPGARGINDAEFLIITAPIWIPAALIYCATGGCKGTKDKQKAAEEERVKEVEQQISAEKRAAAAQGDAQAQFELGLKYEIGGAFTVAVLWYTKSAEQGHVGAQISLGACYEIGNGVEKDDVNADTWYIIAAMSQNLTNERAERARKSRDDLEKRMTPEHIAEARLRAQKWRPASPGTIDGGHNPRDS